MSKPEDQKTQPSEEAFAEMTKIMRLATGALDHPEIGDEELERLCDEALSDAHCNPKK